MMKSEEYRARAEECRSRADRTARETRDQYTSLEKHWRLMAEQAEYMERTGLRISDFNLK
jgi:hypothetical protein